MEVPGGFFWLPPPKGHLKFDRLLTSEGAPKSRLRGPVYLSLNLVHRLQSRRTCGGLFTALLCTQRRQGSDDVAIQLLERALSIRTEKLGEENQDTVDTRNFLELVRRRALAQETE